MNTNVNQETDVLGIWRAEPTDVTDADLDLTPGHTPSTNFHPYRLSHSEDWC